MPKRNDNSLTGLDARELHPLESQWAHDLAADLEINVGSMVVVVHLPGDHRAAGHAEITRDRVFDLFLSPQSGTDVLVRRNPARNSDPERSSVVERLFITEDE